MLPDDGIGHGGGRIKAQNVVQPGIPARDAPVQALVAKSARHEPRRQAQRHGHGEGAVAEAVPEDGHLQGDGGEPEEEKWPGHGQLHLVLREVRPALAAESLLFMYVCVDRQAAGRGG